MYAHFGKRLLDLALGLLAAILLAPVMLAVAVVSAIKLGRPVLFFQLRSGQHGQPFYCWKFRSMSNATDATGALLPDHERLGRYGKFLRSSSIDELPSLFNVLRGEMSLIGPRPLVVRYLDRYSPHQRRRLEVKPGVTGWSQVNGRNELSWADRFDSDVWYVDHLSFGLDVKILFLTVSSVLLRRGISAEGEATMTEFFGNDDQAAQQSKN
jgi:sugar transferase EpsL